jgi:hypothetical protein
MRQLLADDGYRDNGDAHSASRMLIKSVASFARRVLSDIYHCR